MTAPLLLQQQQRAASSSLASGSGRRSYAPAAVPKHQQRQQWATRANQQAPQKVTRLSIRTSAAATAELLGQQLQQPQNNIAAFTKPATTEPQQQQASRVPWYDVGCPPNMRNVSSVQELVDALADAGDKLVIVDFYAPWCRACKAVFPKLCQVMAEHVDDVVFLKVSFEDNKDMCRTMGVKVLPTFHVYHGALGRVDQFSCTVSKFQRFRDALEQHLGAFCSLEEPTALLEEFPEVHPHHPLIMDVHEDDMYDHPPAPVATSPDRPTPVF